MDDYSGHVLDQPKLGVSNDKAVMTWNIDGFGGPYRFIKVDKADLVALAASVDIYSFATDSSHYNVIPVITMGNISTEYAVSINRGRLHADGVRVHRHANEQPELHDARLLGRHGERPAGGRPEGRLAGPGNRNGGRAISRVAEQHPLGCWSHQLHAAR